MLSGFGGDLPVAATRNTSFLHTPLRRTDKQHVNRITCLLLLGIGAALRLAADDRDLTSLSLEQILNMEVASVSKSRAKLSRTPAAVHVITQEDIRRSGAANLPEALRLAPGIQVARIDGQSWAVGMRGFNNFASNKLLVMIDGRSIYNPVLTGVLWNSQLILLEDVERIEVIRGPAGSVWGANAVNGVINVVTKSASATQGTMVAVAGGTMDLARTSARYGAALGKTGAWRTWMQHEAVGMGGELLVQPALRPWTTTHGGFRADWKAGERDEIEIQGQVSTVKQSINFFNYPQPYTLTIDRAQVSSTGGFAMGKWTHTNRRGDASELHISEDIQQNDLGVVNMKVRTFDADLQHSVELSRAHRLVVGGGFRSSAIETEARAQLGFSPANRTYTVSNAFVQHEWTFKPDVLALTLGGKLEQYTIAGMMFQPSLRMIWTPTNRVALWGAISRAVRTPSHVDYTLRYPVGAGNSAALPLTINFLGNEKVRPETLRGLELGTRLQYSRKFLVELSVYRNSYVKLNDVYQAPFSLNPQALAGLLMAAPAPGASARGFELPAIQINGRDITALGGEVEVHYEAQKWWRLTGSYSGSFLSTRVRPGLNPATLINLVNLYPKHMSQLRSSWDIGRRWLADLEVYRTGALVNAGRLALAGYTRVDARLEWKLAEGVALSLQGRNLLRPYQTEYVRTSLFPHQKIGRGISVGLRWDR